MTLTFKRKSTNEIFLRKRIDINKKTQKKDFQKFIFNQLKLNNNSRILDVCCGHGNLTKKILKSKFKELYSIDINKEYINNLKKFRKTNKKFFTNVKDMDKLNFINKEFDYIIFSYCIYYSKNFRLLINKTINLLTKGGEIIIANPYKPHFLVNLIKNIHPVDKKISFSLNISDLIIKFLKKNKKLIVKKEIFKNLTVLNKKDIINSYKNSTMFKKKYFEKVKNKIIKLKKNKFKFYKNTCVIKIEKKK